MTLLKEHVRRVTSKGQVTIPAEVRRLLGVQPGEQVIFRVQGDKVEISRASMSLEEVFGSVQPLNRPEDFEAVRKAAREERAEKVLQEMGEP